jgi:hypothetical protein
MALRAEPEKCCPAGSRSMLKDENSNRFALGPAA